MATDGTDGDRTIRLESWTGPWPDDDPDANFKAEIARTAPLDPLGTLRNLAGAIDVPVGALCHHVLAQWATEGSGALLELGPTMVRRLGAICDEADDAGTDEARLAAYERLRGIVSWLRFPLDHPEVYAGGGEPAHSEPEHRPEDRA